MKKLSDILALAKQTGDFGIEIEVEGRNLPNVDNVVWKTEADGSLRNGKEYIFKKAQSIKTVPVALRNLEKEFKKAAAELQFSFRTSVHVHMNMQDLTYQQILNTIYTYLLLEAPLMSFCDEGRKGNRFCLRLEDAEGAIPVFKNLFFEGEMGLRDIIPDRVRYAAINIEALPKYGSLEFRAMNGTMDVERISTWCQALYNIREFAISQENPSQIFNLFAKIEAEAFVKTVLQDVSKEFTYPNMITDIQRSFSLSLDLPFAYASSQKRKEKKKSIVDAIEEKIIADPRRRVAAAPPDWPVFRPEAFVGQIRGD